MKYAFKNHITDVTPDGILCQWLILSGAGELIERQEFTSNQAGEYMREHNLEQIDSLEYRRRTVRYNRMQEGLKTC